MENIHDKSFVVDGHCDSALNFDGSYNFFERNESVHLDYEKMKIGGINLQFFALFVDDTFIPGSSFSRSIQLLERLKGNVKESGQGKLEFIEKKDGLKKAVNNSDNSQVYGLLTLEGGEALEGKIEHLTALYELGVRGITLTWNRRNELADGCDLENKAGGLTKFGEQVVSKMDQLGMLIDVSHLSQNSFYHLIEITDSPIVASHSNVFSLNNHLRNLTDEQIKIIAESGGLLGINFFSKFLTNKPRADLEDLYKHIKYIVDLVGDNYVALGSDFDGMTSPPKNLEDASKLPNLTDYLLQRGLSESSIEKILGTNWIRVLQNVLPN
ncbi:dipeptidase [Natranaerobius trueperi]|uniref:Dipeptidase n=1 Tax=Natranaerobius trueperi TaxID=759412 RepID=A0A226BW28_9FIRM|nr:dipeptidase [Natranaerobius trueperi]OWZ83111.1 dipeptidase [Natranaerobius trueperi]